MSEAVRISRRELAYNFAWAAWLGLLVLVLLLAIIGSIPTDRIDLGGTSAERVIKTSLVRIQEMSRFGIPVLIALLTICRLVAQQIGPGWIWRTIESLLTEYRLHGFTKEALADNEYYHRVTLFQYVTWYHWWIWVTPQVWRCCWRLRGNAPWRWPGSGWLIVVRRSGNATKRTDVAFLACDDADAAEGIAAQAFLGNKTLSVSNLPNLDENSSQEDIDEYAKNTYVSAAWVRRRSMKNKQRSRSIVATPVEVDNKPWGVLVLDSRSPNGIKGRNTTCDVIITVIARLLKGK